jgi:hypothetical protein
MTSNTNKIALKKNTLAINRPVLPKLLRVRLDSLECARKTTKNSSDLKASVTRTVKLALLENSNTDDSCRVVVNVTLQGTWTTADLPEPVIVFSAIYNAKFSYPTEIEAATAEKWIHDEFYRDAVVSTAMPIINLHMYSQLDMMGIATNSQPLGLPSGGAMKKTGPEKPARRKTSIPKLET